MTSFSSLDGFETVKVLGTYKRMYMKFLLFSFLLSSTLFAVIPTTVVGPLGSSGKGQFVAIEEYEINSKTQSINYKIKILNAWKNKYVGKSISYIRSYKDQESLKQLRDEAAVKASPKFSRYGINI
jgi:hypothetical protein